MAARERCMQANILVSIAFAALALVLPGGSDARIITKTICSRDSDGNILYCDVVQQWVDDPPGWSPMDIVPTLRDTPRLTRLDPAGGGGGTPRRGNNQSDNNSKVAKSPCPGAANPNAASNNPVIIATGEKFLNQDDFSIAGLFRLSRTYRSISLAPSYAPSFGANWASSLEFAQLTGSMRGKVRGSWVATGVANLAQSDGSLTKYYRDADPVYTSDEGLYTARNGSAYGDIYYMAGSDNAWFSGPNFSAEFVGGRITSYYAADGTVDYIFGYDANKRLTSIVVNGSRTIAISYGSNGLVQSISVPNGATWTYTYDGSNRLIRASSPVSTYVDYFYENTSLPSALTGYAVNGVRKTQYTYYADGRVNTSGTVDGEELDTFVYSPTTTTLTNALGLATTYTYQTANGARQVVAMSSNAAAGCAAASSSMEYDANGYMTAQIDAAGVRTEFAYDAQGLLLRSDQAKNTPDQKTTINVWDSYQRLTSVTYRDAAGATLLTRNYTYQGITSTVLSVSEQDPRNGASRSWSYGYTYTSGRLTRLDFTQPGIGTVSQIYDTAGNLTSVVNAKGQVTNYAGYNGLGLPGSATGPDSLTTNYSYDLRGSLLSATEVTPSGSRVTGWLWTPERRLKQVTDPSGLVTQYTYTPIHRT